MLYNYFYKNNFNRLFFFFFNFLSHFSDSSLLKFSNYLNFNLLQINHLSRLKYFKLKKDKLNIYKSSFNLFFFLFNRKEFFFLKNKTLLSYYFMFDYKIKSIDLLKYNNYRSPLLFTIDSHFINSRFINFNLININKFYFKTKNNFFSYNAINCIYSNNFNILYEYFFNIFDKKDFFLRKQFEIIKIQFEREERDRRKNKNKHGKINKTKKKLFFKIFKRPRKYKNQNLSLNNYLYKFLLREIINFEENFNLCRLSFNSIYRSANMISLSYFNFMTNVNFIDRKIFLSGEEFDDMEAFFDNLKENQIQFDKPQLYLYNNHFPIILNSEMVEISFFSQKSKFFSLDFIKFYQFYVSNFFEFLLKKSLYLKVDTNFFKKYSNFDQVEKIVNDFRGHKVKFSRFFHISEMIEII